MAEENTIEEQRMMELEQARMAEESSAQETAKAKTEPRHFIESGEAALLLAFTGCIEIVQWLLDMVPYVGWIVNGGIAFFVGLIFFIWLNGKISKGAPKKWYKAVYAGAAGSIIPIIPGYFGAIIYLYLEDHKLLKKVFGKAGEMAGKALEKVK